MDYRDYCNNTKCCVPEYLGRFILRYFKNRKEKKKSMLLTRFKFVLRLVGNQRTLHKVLNSTCRTILVCKLSQNVNFDGF